MGIFCQCLVHKYLWSVTAQWFSVLTRAGSEIQMFPCFFLAGSSGQNIPVHKVPRSPLSGIPVRTAPAAAVSPMQVQGALSVLVESKEVDTVLSPASADRGKGPEAGGGKGLRVDRGNRQGRGQERAGSRKGGSWKWAEGRGREQDSCVSLSL